MAGAFCRIPDIFAKIIGEMKIKFWGTRGSISVSGGQYLKYGGNTSCVELRSEKNELIVIDAGSGIYPLGRELEKNKTDKITMLFTHSHWDHILGFPFFAPIYRKTAYIKMAGCSYSSGPVREIVLKTMQPPGFPLKFEEIAANFEFTLLHSGGDEISGIAVEPVEISHPGGGFGYKFTEADRSFVFLTDNELRYRHEGGGTPEEYADFCRGADLLIHDADYTPEEYAANAAWGHSTWEHAMELAVLSGVPRLGFFHHNPCRSDSDIDRIVSSAREKAVKSGLKIDCFAAREGQEIKI